MGGITPRSVTAGTVTVDGARLEIDWHTPGGTSIGERSPTLVFLHEGLGCVAMWRDFPRLVADDTGARVLVYSRRGHGRSDAISLPRPLTYMHDEARTVVPELLEALDIDDAVLVGHSDGASIALIYAGLEGADARPSSRAAARVRGLVLLAPHVFCEDISVESIREARRAFDVTDLRAKLARYHGTNTDCAFRGWNDAWLDPGFRAWNIEESLPDIRVPILAIQGEDDRYGTLAQIDAIERGSGAPVTRLILHACGHDPSRDAALATRSAITAFVATLAPPPPSKPPRPEPSAQ